MAAIAGAYRAQSARVSSTVARNSDTAGLASWALRHAVPLAGAVDESDVELAVAQFGELPAGVPLPQGGPHLRVPLPEQGQGGHEHALAGREVQADAQVPARRRARVPGRPHGAVQLPDRLGRFPPERFSRGRQPHAVRGPGHELDAEAALELLQLQAQRRLRDVQAGGGPAEVQLLGEDEKRVDVTQFHQPSAAAVKAAAIAWCRGATIAYHSGWVSAYKSPRLMARTTTAPASSGLIHR